MRLYTPRILSFFLALCPFLAAEAAQPLYSVSGRVTDAATGEPVTGAVVMVKDTYKGTETDMEGRWRLDNLAAGDYTFAVSFISYKSIEVSCRGGRRCGGGWMSASKAIRKRSKRWS